MRKRHFNRVDGSYRVDKVMGFVDDNYLKIRVLVNYGLLECFWRWQGGGGHPFSGSLYPYSIARFPSSSSQVFIAADDDKQRLFASVH